MEDELAEHIKRALAAGYSSEYIKEACAEAGWSNEEYSQAIKIVTNDQRKSIPLKWFVLIFFGIISIVTLLFTFNGLFKVTENPPIQKNENQIRVGPDTPHQSKSEHTEESAPSLTPATISNIENFSESPELNHLEQSEVSDTYQETTDQLFNTNIDTTPAANSADSEIISESVNNNTIIETKIQDSELMRIESIGNNLESSLIKETLIFFYEDSGTADIDVSIKIHNSLLRCSDRLSLSLISNSQTLEATLISTRQSPKDDDYTWMFSSWQVSTGFIKSLIPSIIRAEVACEERVYYDESSGNLYYREIERNKPQVQPMAALEPTTLTYGDEIRLGATIANIQTLSPGSYMLAVALTNGSDVYLYTEHGFEILPDNDARPLFIPFIDVISHPVPPEIQCTDKDTEYVSLLNKASQLKNQELGGQDIKAVCDLVKRSRIPEGEYYQSVVLVDSKTNERLSSDKSAAITIK
jgi:hypothetical protein